jgi:hypothetical protein
MTVNGLQDDTLVPFSAHEDHAFGVWNQVVIAIWRVQTRPIAAQELGKLIGDCVRRRPGGIALLQIIEDTARAPDPPARQALAKMHGEYASAIRRSALVFAKPGFAGAAVRAVMTGVAMLNPPKFEHQLFGNIPAALAWLDQDLWPKGNTAASMGLRRAVKDLRALQAVPPTRNGDFTRARY